MCIRDRNQVDAMRNFSEEDGVAHFINSSLNKSAIDQDVYKRQIIIVFTISCKSSLFCLYKCKRSSDFLFCYAFPKLF